MSDMAMFRQIERGKEKRTEPLDGLGQNRENGEGSKAAVRAASPLRIPVRTKTEYPLSGSPDSSLLHISENEDGQSLMWRVICAESSQINGRT
jgi:hypothetical protein